MKRSMFAALLVAGLGFGLVMALDPVTAPQLDLPTAPDVDTPTNAPSIPVMTPAPDPLEGCGNQRCEPPEDCDSCPQDCGDCCGNSRCEPPEDCNSCPQDCC